MLRCAIYSHLEIKFSAKWHFSEVSSTMTGFQISQSIYATKTEFKTHSNTASEPKEDMRILITKGNC